ncbi:MAG: precorrin-3B C(17)-methyltransferase [Alphaproteobacteria bacterium]|nr:precorrin-3B C(17)-methyltransferase [Alphaproteobacteria bacterium]
MTVAVALTERGAALAERLGLNVVPLDALESRFCAGEPVIAVMAAGIVIRRLAPLLADKRDEPPVIAVAEDGSAVVPLLGGHRGANRLARRFARTLGVQAAVTTASDVLFGVALDDPPPGWTLANPEMAKPVMAALIAGEPVRLEAEAGDTGWLAPLPWSQEGRLVVRVSDRSPVLKEGELLLHPPSLLLGVGLERGAPADLLFDHVAWTLEREGLARASLAAVATLDLKGDEPAVAALDLPVRLFDAAALDRIDVPNPSSAVAAAVGTASVAEAAALAAAGEGAVLAVPKRVGRRVTCAVARMARPQGRLTVVGIGPGAPSMRTAEAKAAIAGATDIVGYGPYLDLVADLAGAKRCHRLAIGEEGARADLALRLARDGNAVALLASGDAGIYALAGLVLERGHDAVPVTVLPGISAMQAASARAGAPLGHDFSVISLSDLLTPLETICARIEAAASADFVIAFYNPASKDRRRPLERALAVLACHRNPDTPVVRARNLGRADELVAIETLAGLDRAAVDMATVLIVGNSQTKLVAGRVVTPRGYQP